MIILKIKKASRSTSSTNRITRWVLILFGYTINLTKEKSSRFFAVESWNRARKIRMHDFVGCEGFTIGQTGARYSGYVIATSRYRIKVHFQHVDYTKWIKRSEIQKLELKYHKVIDPGYIADLDTNENYFYAWLLTLWILISKKNFVHIKISRDYLNKHFKNDPFQYEVQGSLNVICHKKDEIRLPHSLLLAKSYNFGLYYCMFDVTNRYVIYWDNAVKDFPRCEKLINKTDRLPWKYL